MVDPEMTQDRRRVAAPVGQASLLPRSRQTYTEAKAGFKASEFYVMVLFVAGVLLSTYADQDSLTRRDGWLLASFAVAAYIISRGLAKLGTREPYTEAR